MTRDGAATTIADQLNVSGFAIVPRFLSPREIADLR